MDEEIDVEELLLRISTAQRNINNALTNFQSTRDLGIKLNENFRNLQEANQLLNKNFAQHFENLKKDNNLFLANIKAKFEKELASLAANQLAAPTQKISESLQIISNLTKKTEELQMSFQNTFQAISDQAETLQNTLKGLKWDEELNTFKQNVATFWKELQDWIKKIDFAQQFTKIGEQITAIKTVQAQINNLDLAKKADISKEISELKTQITGLKTQLTGLDFATKADFNQKINTLEIKISGLKTDFSQEITSLKTQLTELKTQVSSLDFTKKADFDHKISELKTQVSSLDFTKKADFDREINELKTQVSSLEQQNNNLQIANNQIFAKLKIQNIILFVILAVIILLKFIR